MAICIANANNIPGGQLQILSSHVDVLKKTRYIDQLLKVPELLEVAKELNARCIRERVIGFHFTRAIRASIERHGLVIVPGAERRNNFLAEFGHYFSEVQQRRIKQAWEAYFPGQQDRSRNGQVCFALTRKPLRDGGATDLLRHFGGEAIYMPIADEADLAKVLHNLGEPLIIQCALDTTRSKTFHEYPWGAAWLSSYHCFVNSDAHQYDQDVFVQYPVPASDIISITNAEPWL